MSNPQAYTACKAALQAAPYAGLSDAQAAAEAQTHTTVQWQDVTTQAIAAYLGNHMILAAFLRWAAAPPSDATQAAQEAAAELALAFQQPALVPSFVMSDPTTRANMQGALSALANALPAGSASTPCPVTQTHATAILELAQTSVPDWQVWGFRQPPSDVDISVARTWP